MGLQSAFFLTTFAVLIIASVANPFWGVLAYMAHYYVWPEKQWWGEMLAAAEIRVSLTVSAVMIVSTVAHWSRLRNRLVGPLFHSQELLFWAYISVIGLAEVWGLPQDVYYQPTVNPLDKMIKIGIFSFLLTHIVVTKIELERYLWFVMIVGGAYLGYLAYTLPATHFVKGRLEGVGGPDFTDSNFAAAHFVVMGILATMLLLKSKTWMARIVCSPFRRPDRQRPDSHALRGAFVGVITAGLAGVVMVDRKIRKHLLWAVPIVLIGCYSLTDDLFWERISTMFVAPEELDASSESRLEFWKVATQIFFDHPLGIGPGRFYGVIGDYRPEYAGRDTHSLYFRTLAELGIFGITALLAMIGNSFWVLHRCKKKARNLLGSPDCAFHRHRPAVDDHCLHHFGVNDDDDLLRGVLSRFAFARLPRTVDRSCGSPQLARGPQRANSRLLGGPRPMAGGMQHGHPAALRLEMSEGDPVTMWKRAACQLDASLGHCSAKRSCAVRLDHARGVAELVHGRGRPAAGPAVQPADHGRRHL